MKTIFLFSVLLVSILLSCSSSIEPLQDKSLTRIKPVGAKVASNYPAFLTGQWKMKTYSSSYSPVNPTAYKAATGYWLTNRWLYLGDNGYASITDWNNSSPTSFSSWGSNSIDFFAWQNFPGEVIYWVSDLTVNKNDGQLQFTRMWDNGGTSDYVHVSFDPYSNYTLMYWQMSGFTLVWERASGGPSIP